MRLPAFFATSLIVAKLQIMTFSKSTADVMLCRRNH